jgi:ankyrin repeat protein
MGSCFIGHCTAKTLRQSHELQRAIGSDNFTLVKQLVNTGSFDLDFDAGSGPGYYDGTPLQQAAIRDTTDCFVYLVQHGANLLHVVDPATNTSIFHLAAMCGSLGVVHYLLEDCGFQVNNNFPTPLDYAANFGHK